jgi:hypothetical protein
MALPWAKDVRAVLNMEGSGTGGKALVFRSEVNQLSYDYATGANTPNANVVANLVFASGIVSSYTDYDETFGKRGIASMDIAYYASRYLYHTPGDDIAHTAPGSLQQFGESMMGTLGVMGNDMALAQPGFIPPNPRVNKEPLPTYYDILSNSMLYWSSTGYIIANTVLVAVISLFVLARAMWLKKHAVQLKERSRPILVSFGFLAASIFTGIMMGIIMNLIPIAANPDFVYSNPYLAFAISAAAQLMMYSIFARVSSQRWDRIRRSTHLQPESLTQNIFDPSATPVTQGAYWDGVRGTGNPSEDGFWVNSVADSELTSVHHQVYDWHPRGDVAFREAFHSLNCWWFVCLLVAWVLSWFSLPVLYWIFWFAMFQAIGSFLYMLGDEWLRPKLEHYNTEPPMALIDATNGKGVYPMETADGIVQDNGNVNGSNGNANTSYGVAGPVATTTPRPSTVSSWLWAICWMIAVAFPFILYADFMQSIIDTYVQILAPTLTRKVCTHDN